MVCKGQGIRLLDKGFVELQDIMGDDMAIVNAARVSFLGESKGEVKDKKLLFYLMENQHISPFEMVEFKFRVKCPLFVRSQWFRHDWSFNEVSRRYTSERIEFYIPAADEWRTQSKDNKQGSEEYLNDESQQRMLTIGFQDRYAKLLNFYSLMTDELSIAREQARAILPQATYTTFIGKTNARNLLFFLKQRMSKDAQYEIRVYAQAIYHHFFKPLLPWTAEAAKLYLFDENVKYDE